MNVVVIGGGASGMIAAITSARNNNKVTIVEKNSELGKKLKITGKGRCNITFDGDSDNFKKNVVKNFQFLYSAFSKFDNKDTVKFFNEIGIPTKVERGGRIFPVCDDAKQVLQALKRQINNLNINVLYNTSVTELIVKSNKLEAVKTDKDKTIKCDKCIIATGGTSYKSTGSTGDGYKLLSDLGHKIIDIKPGLVPLKSNSLACKNLQGLSLKNVCLTIYDNEKALFKDFGEMLFSHFGITGPIVLTSSSVINRIEGINEKIKNKSVFANIDLKPALTLDMLDKRIQKDFEKYNNKEFKNSLNDLLPQKIIPEVIKLSGINESVKVNQITKEQRLKLVKVIKNFVIPIDGFMNIDMGIITCGGVDVKQINPKNMESKLIKNLYVCGELLDLDALTGGYNLQIAFSTGFVAGSN